MADTSAIEQDIAAARARLQTTVNELAYRTQPQVVAERQVQGLKLKVDEATRTPEGDLRLDRVLPVVAAVVGVLVLRSIVRRRRKR